MTVAKGGGIPCQKPIPIPISPKSNVTLCRGLWRALILFPGQPHWPPCQILKSLATPRYILESHPWHHVCLNWLKSWIIVPLLTPVVNASSFGGLHVLRNHHWWLWCIQDKRLMFLWIVPLWIPVCTYIPGIPMTPMFYTNVVCYVWKCFIGLLWSYVESLKLKNSVRGFDG